MPEASWKDNDRVTGIIDRALHFILRRAGVDLEKMRRDLDEKIRPDLAIVRDVLMEAAGLVEHERTRRLMETVFTYGLWKWQRDQAYRWQLSWALDRLLARAPEIQAAMGPVREPETWHINVVNWKAQHPDTYPRTA